MDKSDAMKAAEDLYGRSLGNVPIMAARLSEVTTLTRRRAESLLESGVVEYVADLLQDFDGEF